jgi:Ti-type conjugative transfer relaxase TraA
MEFVKRSEGKNACAKSAYNSRSRIQFSGSDFAPERVYNWAHKPSTAYSSVLLPEGASAKFQCREKLWNLVERTENRKNSQLALEIVIALPDDRIVTLDDRKELALSFAHAHFVSKGLAVQLDIHPPENMLLLRNGEEGAGDHNWHAHLTVTTRRFRADGKGFERLKARDLMPDVCKGRVVAGENWGKVWASHQNAYFKSRGIDLKVDLPGVVSQDHLGPVRMRGRAIALIERNETAKELNSLESTDPVQVLNHVLSRQSTFSRQDIDRYAEKHIPGEYRASFQTEFWQQTGLVPLLDTEKGEATGLFSTSTVMEEERACLRLSDHLNAKPASLPKNLSKGTDPRSGLTEEQAKAFDKIISGSSLAIVEGHAGTGKSYLLNALKDTYEASRRTVRAMGPDTATVKALSHSGLDKAETIHRFLFRLKNGRVNIRKGKEVWMVDESGKLDNQAFREILRQANRCGAQLILSGCSSQLPPVGRGDMFRCLSSRFGASYLEDIQRQEREGQREMARELAKGAIGKALDRLVDHKGLHWTNGRSHAIESLAEKWAADRTLYPGHSSLIIAKTNKDVQYLNQLVREYRKRQGEISSEEYECETLMGKIVLSRGDSIEFRKKCESLGVENGLMGVVDEVSQNRLSVKIIGNSGSRTVSFDPKSYGSYQLGYAVTSFRSQGRTVDRAYVLHDRSMTQPMFYVGLTRHVKEAHLFVSKQNARGVADLKNQLSQKVERLTTLDFTSEPELKGRESRQQGDVEASRLCASPYLPSRLLGYGKKAVLSMKSGWNEFRQSQRDRREDVHFYSYSAGRNSAKSFDVARFEDLELPAYEKKSPSDLANSIGKRIELSDHKSAPAKNNKIPKVRSWSPLKDSERRLLSKYFEDADRASVLKDEQSESIWKASCGQRNRSAFDVISQSSQERLKQAIGPRALEILQDRACRHEEYTERKNQLPAIESGLRAHAESLLYRLFPEGPMRRDGQGVRLGNKGSLAVCLRGLNAGVYYDHENKQGGGLLGLVGRELGLDRQEAIRWSRGFLGVAPSMTSVPSIFRTNTRMSRQSSWISQVPGPGEKAPPLSELSRSLAHRYNEVARYPYRSAEGHDLFYILRLEAKDGSGKSIRPLSYGFQEGESQAHWSIRGYSGSPRPLYNQDLLTSMPNAPVLVVEGEKTAESAQSLFGVLGYVCTTWFGGASAVGKSNWSILQDRQVLIWPDNDRAGKEAASQVRGALNKCGARQVGIVQLPSYLPEKWDLADEIPARLDPKILLERSLLKQVDRSISR